MNKKTYAFEYSHDKRDPYVRRKRSIYDKRNLYVTQKTYVFDKEARQI